VRKFRQPHLDKPLERLNMSTEGESVTAKLSGKRTMVMMFIKRAFWLVFYLGGTMKAVVTIIGEDKVGIISAVSNILSNCNCNILDINQTVMREYFTMIMLVDLEKMTMSMTELQNEFSVVEEEMKLSIRVQREDIFKKMHEV